MVFAASHPDTGYAAFPGANGKIAFCSDGTANNEIHVMNADGSGQTNLTNNPAFDCDPAWSADGTKIAFESNRDSNFEIYVMNADGSAQTRLTDTPGDEFGPAWSPDGTKITYFRSDAFGKAEIFVINADGSGETKLTNNGLFDIDPAWSPDGTKIAFVRAIFGGTSEVYVMNADGSGQAQLSPSDGRLVNGPNWSPDGTRIAYGGGFGFGATADIYVINADGSGQTNLTPSTPGSETVPAWSPDGTKIAFVSDRDGINAHIYVMNADGSGQTSLTNNPANNGSPDWQPLVTISVEIDIKPGNLPNSINLKSKGVVPVAVLGSPSFNVDDVDVNTVEFAGAMPVRFSFEDVNLDGHVDLVFHFRAQDLQLATSSTQATLTAETTGGAPITGTDSVRIVK